MKWFAAGPANANLTLDGSTAASPVSSTVTVEPAKAATPFEVIVGPPWIVQPGLHRLLRGDVVITAPAALAATKPGSGASTPPTAADTRRFLREIERVIEALSRPPGQAAPVIADYQAEGDIHRFYRESMPSPTRVNDNRREVKGRRGSDASQY